MSDYRNYFKNNDLVLSKLEKLHVKKYHLKEMISAKDIPPFIVEFSGLPRTGKSSSLNRVYDFFKQANIRIEKTTEPAQIIKESMSKEEVSKLTNVEFNNQTLYIAKEELSRKINQQPSIIIQDRGVIDNYFWYQMMYDEGKIDANFYQQLLLNLYQDLECVDQLFILCAEPETIIIRDYINQIYLEPRKKRRWKELRS
jgi:thymidylate kinase